MICHPTGSHHPVLPSAQVTKLLSGDCSNGPNIPCKSTEMAPSARGRLPIWEFVFGIRLRRGIRGNSSSGIRLRKSSSEGNSSSEANASSEFVFVCSWKCPTPPAAAMSFSFFIAIHSRLLPLISFCFLLLSFWVLFISFWFFCFPLNAVFALALAHSIRRCSSSDPIKLACYTEARPMPPTHISSITRTHVASAKKVKNRGPKKATVKVFGCKISRKSVEKEDKF